MSHTMKNQSTELTKEQRRRLARAIKAIILGKSAVEGLQDGLQDGQKTNTCHQARSEDNEEAKKQFEDGGEAKTKISFRQTTQFEQTLDTNLKVI